MYLDALTGLQKSATYLTVSRNFVILAFYMAYYICRLRYSSTNDSFSISLKKSIVSNDVVFSFNFVKISYNFILVVSREHKIKNSVWLFNEHFTPSEVVNYQWPAYHLHMHGVERVKHIQLFKTPFRFRELRVSFLLQFLRDKTRQTSNR